MKGFTTIGLLVLSNSFMTIAWYGHLKFKDSTLLSGWGLPAIVLVSWLIALFEYSFMIPANRMGYSGNGGPFSLMQLKVIQEVITLVVFVLFSLIVFKNERISSNHFIGFLLLIGAVYFMFKK